MAEVIPIRPEPPTFKRSEFDELQIQMMDWLNALHCACAVLAQSDLIDQDEPTSRARSLAHACNANLHRLMDELESWELRTRHERPAVG
jgi:hypothetical protein